MSKNFQKLHHREQKMLLDTLKHIEGKMSDPALSNTFLNSLLTEKERFAIARRLLIASMIQRGDTYRAINEKLSISPNTFTTIKKWLEEELPDYQTALEHTEKAACKRAISHTPQKKDYGAPFSMQRLKHSYPAHFLLFTLAETLFTKMK